LDTNEVAAEVQQTRGLDRIELFKSIIERSKTILFLWRYEKDWPVEFVSDNIASFGYSSKQFLMGLMTWKKFVYSKDILKADKEFEYFANKGMSDNNFIQEYRVVTKDNDIRWVSDRTKVIKNSDGIITHVQSILVDITEEKQLEEQLVLHQKELELLVRKRTKQLEKANDKLNIQKLELEQKNIALGVVLKEVETYNKQIKKDVVFSVNKLLLPVLRTLKKRSEYLEAGYITLLENTVIDLSSSFARDLSGEDANLTPREIEICNMVKNNLSSKEIAELLFITIKSVEWHRYNIRRKFGILNQKINLTTFLRNL